MEKKSVIKKITGSREALLAIIVIVLFAVVTAISPSFLTPKSLMEMLKNNAVTMVMSHGHNRIFWWRLHIFFRIYEENNITQNSNLCKRFNDHDHFYVCITYD